MDRPLYSSEECCLIHASMTIRIDALEATAIDHVQRFETIQTPSWKRLIFWLDGWPSRDLNAARPQWRPWRRWWTS